MRLPALVLVTVLVSGCSVRGLQVGFVAANVADLHSTQVALDAGATEANPVMRGPVGRQVALKAASTGLMLWATEKLKGDHPAAVRALLTATTAALTIISGHNYHTAAEGRQ